MSYADRAQAGQTIDGGGGYAPPTSGATLTQTVTNSGTPATNTVLLGPIDTTGFASFSLQAVTLGSGVNNIYPQQSNENNGGWQNVAMTTPSSTSYQQLSTTNNGSITRANLSGRFLQILNSGAQTGGTTLFILTLYTQPFSQIAPSTYACTGAINSGGNSTAPFQTSSLSNTVQAIKASAGNLYDYDLYNSGASAACVQIFGVPSGSVVLGTTVPLWHCWVPAGGTKQASFSLAKNGSTGLSIVATTTYMGSTAPATALDACVGYF